MKQILSIMKKILYTFFIIIMVVPLTGTVCEGDNRKNIENSRINEQINVINKAQTVPVSFFLCENANNIEIPPRYDAFPEKELYNIEQYKNIPRQIQTFGEMKVPNLDKITKTLNSYGKPISLVAVSVDGKQGIFYNTNAPYFSACTIKMPYCLYLCKSIDAGKINPDEVLTYKRKHYHTGSGNIQYQPYGTQYKVRDLINLCLSISDNVAYEILFDRYGRDDYNNFINLLNCPSLKLIGMWGHNVRPYEFAVVWGDVYQYFQTETIGAQILKTACTNTRANFGTKALKGIEYSHKSGNVDNKYKTYNDAGIVWGTNPYIYCIFTGSVGQNYDVWTINNVMINVNEIMKREEVPICEN